MTVALTGWCCRILLTRDPHGPAVTGFGKTATAAARDAARKLRGREAHKTSTFRCSTPRRAA